MSLQLKAEESTLGPNSNHAVVPHQRLSRRPPRQQASSSRSSRQSSHPGHYSSTRLGKAATLERNEEVQHERNHSRANSEGNDGVQGVLGGSNGAASRCEEQKLPTGMPAITCSRDPAINAIGISLKTFRSSSIYMAKQGAERSLIRSLRGL